MENAVVDAGVLIASVDTRDSNHGPCAAALARPDLRLMLPAFCVAEATYIIGGRLGARAEEHFLRGLQPFDVRAPEPDDFLRMADIVRQYADFPLGGTDASVVALAERVRARIVLTLDHRHFGAIRPRHCERFTLLPEL
jgi:predicted nucleic acid-binding protein